MASTDKRKNFSTNLDKRILRRLKIIAADFNKNQNQIIEEGIELVNKKVMDQFLKGKSIEIKESTDRKLKNTTIDRKLYHDLKVIKARTDININTLIEEGLRMVFKKYNYKSNKRKTIY